MALKWPTNENTITNYNTKIIFLQWHIMINKKMLITIITEAEADLHTIKLHIWPTARKRSLYSGC